MLFVSLLEIMVPSALKIDSPTYRLVEFRMNVELASETLSATFGVKVSLRTILGRPASANV